VRRSAHGARSGPGHKPSALGSALALVVALVAGPLAAVPFWRSGDRPTHHPAPDTIPRARIDGEPVATPASGTQR